MDGVRPARRPLMMAKNGPSEVVMLSCRCQTLSDEDTLFLFRLIDYFQLDTFQRWSSQI